MIDQTHADWLRDFLQSFWAFAAGRAKREHARDVEYRLCAIADYLEAKDRTIAALTAERDRLREALGDACGTIEGLVDQQAMPDGWYKNSLDKARAALKGETE